MIFRGSKHISSVSENRLISLLALACSSRSLWGICDAFKIPTFGKVQKILDFFSAFTVAPFLLILIRRQMCIDFRVIRIFDLFVFEYTLSQCLQIDKKVELGCLELLSNSRHPTKLLITVCFNYKLSKKSN